MKYAIDVPVFLAAVHESLYRRNMIVHIGRQAVGSAPPEEQVALCNNSEWRKWKGGCTHISRKYKNTLQFLFRAFR